jgi:hypothetical protein
MMPTTSAELSPQAPPTAGQVVRVRHRRYLVEEINSPTYLGEATVNRMACLDDDAQLK